MLLQDISAVYLFALGLWAIITLALWVSTGVSRGWGFSNSILKIYTGICSIAIIPAALLIIILSAAGVK